MDMPGSQTALEELVCRVLGDFSQEGCEVKHADDLYGGGDTLREVLNSCNLRLSVPNIVIHPSLLLSWVGSGHKASCVQAPIAFLH